ncbi:hypothetical protein [Methylobacterium sp. 391_Methyba4]|uniref:hypothetical protein n=1 Tax=Methylobacterium sp. 391_Methyba4 TaxID=3038924 RepID=UPI00241EDA4D|nr:hypothetical protein [Methylobacterium sp. 391_Methyba4]WFS09555.1 hypothetical protein P9K36_09800 [Methylobacterium sp. 391_Methyba4]
MKSTFVALAAIGGVMITQPYGQASQLPSYFLGRWTSTKDKCADPENITFIAQKSFRQYESTCQVGKVAEHNNVTPGFFYYIVDLKCRDEGEMSARTITFTHKSNKNIMTIGGLGKSQVVYRCDRK